jgi:hypothetical protein
MVRIARGVRFIPPAATRAVTAQRAVPTDVWVCSTPVSGLEDMNYFAAVFVGFDFGSGK